MVRKTAAAFAVLGTIAALPAVAGEAAVNPMAESGFDLVVLGSREGMSAARFAETVATALPEELKDPQSNFTRHETYRPEEHYRLVFVFHDAAEEPPGDLCALGDDPQRVTDTPQPGFEDLHSTVVSTAAFCAGPAALATTANRTAGYIEPDSLSFRFLVADIAKDLFPDGFGRLPRSVPTTNGIQ